MTPQGVHELATNQVFGLNEANVANYIEAAAVPVIAVTAWQVLCDQAMLGEN
jgi:hypothetical protein